MDVIKGKEYKVVPVGAASCNYFGKKYGTPNPTIRIEDRDTVLWKGGWGMQDGNPACLLFAARTGMDGCIAPTEVWYGKIITKEPWSFGELVCEEELEVLNAKV